jgi:hypothetical protein
MKTRWILRLLALEGLLFTTLLTIAVWNGREDRAIIGMTWGLITIWIITAGSLMHRHRQRLAVLVNRLPGSPGVQFVTAATLLAMVEEMVTTGMSNLAPLFGVERGSVMITASTNYFDVILRNSVVVFVPMFVVWAWLLNRYEIRPALALLLFGLTGTLAEVFSSGPQHLLGIGIWTYVYGLMIYVPSVAFRRTSPRPRRLTFFAPVAVVLPLLAAAPVALLVLAVR